MEKNQAVLQQLSQILERKGIGREELEGMLDIVHPVDLAFILEDLEPEEKVAVFKLMDTETAAAVLVELDDLATREIVNLMPRDHLEKVLAAMTPDDAAATVRLMAEEHGREAALDFLARRQREQVRELLHYDEETAGSLMTTNYVAVRPEMSAAEGLKALQGAVQANTVVYIYAVDGSGMLRGVLSIRNLLHASPETLIRDIMHPDLITVLPEMDQEEVARIIKRYSLEAVPVVDSTGRMLGVVTSKSVMNIIEAEAEEDLLTIAGAGGLNVFADRVMRRVILRIPWLIPPLLGGLLVGKIQDTFAKFHPEDFIALVLFIPVMMGTAGNVAVQSSTLVVRGLATGEIKPGRIFQILWAELRVGILIGLVCGTLIGAAGAVFKRFEIGVIVSVSMLAAITAAATNGTAFPLLLARFKADPAISAGPFITALNDITATLIYMLVAILMLEAFA